MSDDGSGKGLHIDSDWKEEAAREKERLSEQERTDAGADTGKAPAETGPVAFSELINVLAMQAAIALGGYQGPGGERIPPNLAAAKHHIDLLAILEEKTKGNLADDEKRALDGVLYELRMQYVQSAGGGMGQKPQKT
jgi:hypothetical protein